MSLSNLTCSGPPSLRRETDVPTVVRIRSVGGRLGDFNIARVEPSAHLQTCIFRADRLEQFEPVLPDPRSVVTPRLCNWQRRFASGGRGRSGFPSRADKAPFPSRENRDIPARTKAPPFREKRRTPSPRHRTRSARGQCPRPLRKPPGRSIWPEYGAARALAVFPEHGNCIRLVQAGAACWPRNKCLSSPRCGECIAAILSVLLVS